MPTRRPERVAALVPGALLAALLALPHPAAAQQSARPLVVIDAGHGGADPGAKGPGGTREKDVALAVARRLAALLRERGGLEVRMTRERDTLVALADRPSLANAWRAEAGAERPALFLSIHANAHRRASARGVETYFLSEALTEDARRVEEMENAAQRYEDAGPAGGDALSFIFNDLRQNLYLRDSSAGAEIVQRSLAAAHPGPDRGVKQAAFVVLNGAFMPAVLVELGFITNPRDEALLADAAHQKELARGLAAAVADFFGRRAEPLAAGGS